MLVARKYSCVRVPCRSALLLKVVLQKRGAVLGALSGSDTRFRLPLELSEALGLPFDGPSGPYVRRKPELVEYSKGLTNIPVPAQLQVNEAASLFEVWMKDKALFSRTPTVLLRRVAY